MSTPSTPFRDKSIAALTGASQALFADAGYQGAEERLVHNPDAAASIAVNLIGAAAVLNGAGSITIPPLGFFTTKHTGAIAVIGTAGKGVTAHER